MPVYVFQCKTCGEQFEKLMRFSEMDEQPECPACQGKDTHKKLTAFNAYSNPSTFGTWKTSSGQSCQGGGKFT